MKMKFGNWKLEIGNLLIILLFFFLFLFPSLSREGLGVGFVFAQTDTGTTTTVITTGTTTPIATTSEPNLIEKFLAWISNLFAKTDYTIDPSRSFEAKIEDMTNYGDNKDPNNKEKHSFAGSRLTDANSQNCLKGNVIKKVILGDKDTDLSQICLDSANICTVKPISNSNTNCKTITIKDLGKYFVQINKPFYCDSNNKLLDIEEPIKNKFSNETIIINNNEYGCYEGIYDDFYLTPKEANQEDENTKIIMQTPLPASSQNSNDSTNDINNKVNQNFSYEGTNCGPYCLRPENDK